MVASKIRRSGRDREGQYFIRHVPVKRGDTISGNTMFTWPTGDCRGHCVCMFLFLGQIASFERCLRGAAPTPLALPYPFRTRPGIRMGTEGENRKVVKILYFGAVLSSFRLDLDVCTV